MSFMQSAREPDTWQRALQTALRTAQDLLREGLIRADEVPAFERILKRYPMTLPRYYASLIDRADPHCPIRRQAIAQIEELDDPATAESDPLEDLAHQPVPRITHRYPSRLLLHLTPNCSMVCRYCFRKTLLSEKKEQFTYGPVDQALNYIAAHPEVHEVIFSGGDPLLAAPSELARCLRRLGTFSHIRRIRFHTRVPVTLPMRVDAELSRLLNCSGKTTAVVTHFNHPRELTPQAGFALALLRNEGLHLLNQSVLLKGVNDSVEPLADLSEQLFDAGVLPYYLHHPDRARGTLHFDVAVAEGLNIHRELKARLPGYLVPRYVRDDPRWPFKADVSGLST